MRTGAVSERAAARAAVKRKCRDELAARIEKLLESPPMRRLLERKNFMAVTFALSEALNCLRRGRLFSLAELMRLSMWLEKAESGKLSIGINSAQVSGFFADMMVKSFWRSAEK
jgi:hypothetical protein